MVVNGLEEYTAKLSKLGKDAEKIAKKVVRAGANPVADQIKKNLMDNLNDPAYVGKGNGGPYKKYKFTGDLLKAFGITPPGVDRNGNTNVHIGFDGYDRNGVPNQLKARAMESGTSWLRKRPFIRPAVNKTKNKAIEQMGKKLDEEIKAYDF
ncbi:HK97-gp10 family putative phage morphogenesis protein [Clostridium thermarum]|uniref:HK97-gp10 family putative phage morphogenesis protein n=1 Tax=Clostridium thermarum TaxID=1716543 RepID=UPI001FAA09D8|nr:HK97-gp10 family putative phage morphogenesis protein [Clostridium thermarum]